MGQSTMVTVKMSSQRLLLVDYQSHIGIATLMIGQNTALEVKAVAVSPVMLETLYKYWLAESNSTAHHPLTSTISNLILSVCI